MKILTLIALALLLPTSLFADYAMKSTDMSQDVMPERMMDQDMMRRDMGTSVQRTNRNMPYQQQGMTGRVGDMTTGAAGTATSML